MQHLLLVWAAYIVAAGSPGPSTMRIVGVAMRQGRQAGLAMYVGAVTGSIFWGLMAATGISALLTQYAHALILLKIFGGLYLIYLAVKAGKAALTPERAAAPSAKTVENGQSRHWDLYRRGLLMHLSNPKSILAWIALVTLGLGPNASLQTVAIILAGCAVLSVSIFCGYAIVFSTAPMVRFYSKARRSIEGTLAIIFAYAGVRLLFARI